MTREIYKPTPLDKEGIKIERGKLKVSGDGVFATLQGEGVTVGEPAVFLRLHFCNLNCTWCDSKYTWDPKTPEFWQEPENWNTEETIQNISDSWDAKFGNRDSKRLVITGGEPMLQKEKLVFLVERLPSWEIEIETNGTQFIPEELSHCQINCSPKLANSKIDKKRRIRPEALKQINILCNSWFKFVAGNSDDLEEIEEIVRTCKLNNEKVLVMPLGNTVKLTSNVINEIKEKVDKHGWRITDRKHLVWFGSKRRT